MISGDAIDRAENLGALKAFLEAISDLERVAVLGNWEYWSEVNLADLRRLYEAQRVRLLVNEIATYRLRGTRLQVVGLDDFTVGKPPERILKSAGQAEISLVVQHSPGMFEAMERVGLAVEADLCLSGHTHGGQLRVFGWAPWTPPGSGSFTAGMYRTEGCPLYVSRGIGTSLVAARFGSRPEIAVFDIGVKGRAR
ncbi:MAG: hypothetical protein RIS35_2438 [Pseudomonadota bacterium]